MDYEFSSVKELFERVRPALRAKIAEFQRMGYQNVTESDIWNYLIDAKWRKGKDLMLSDIVSDIMNFHYSDFQKNMEHSVESEKQPFVDSVEIL